MLDACHQIHEFGGDSCHAEGHREFLVIVHALQDSVFEKYARSATASDLPLFRGLFLKVSSSLTCIPGIQLIAGDG